MENLKYRSTRGDFSCNSLEAVLMGIAPDGGLLVSEQILQQPFDWKAAIGIPTLEMADLILSHLLPDFKDMPGLVRRAYKDKGIRLRRC